MKNDVFESVQAIRRLTDTTPDIALILGSGLGALADNIDGVAIPYSEIPHFPVSTVQGHDGVLVIGTLFGRSCVAMRGRVHMYEGYSAQEVAFPMRVMAALGAKVAVITNAAGAMGEGMKVGDLVAIEDHLSLAVASGHDPLRGPNEPEFGERFVSMNQAYDPALIDLLQSVSPEIGRGVYGHAIGPSFEPPALIRLLKLADVDLVGMSTVPEVIVARHMGVRVLAISAVTNIAVTSVKDSHITNEEEVWDTVKIVQPKLLALMQALIPVLPASAA